MKLRGSWADTSGVKQSAQAKALHDLLLAMKPGDVEHLDCALCPDLELEEPMSDKTFTQDELDAAVAAALAPLRQQIDEMRASAETAGQAAALEAAVAEATGPLKDEIADLTTRLDAAVAEARVATEKHDQLVALLEETETARLEAEAAAERREGRIAEASAIASWFNEDDIAERADAWAAKSDEDWAAQLAEYQTLAARLGDALPAPKVPPATTAMTAADDRTTRRSAVSGLSGLLTDMKSLDRTAL